MTTPAEHIERIQALAEDVAGARTEVKGAQKILGSALLAARREGVAVNLIAGALGLSNKRVYQLIDEAKKL